MVPVHAAQVTSPELNDSRKTIKRRELHQVRVPNFLHRTHKEAAETQGEGDPQLAITILNLHGFSLICYYVSFDYHE